MPAWRTGKAIQVEGDPRSLVNRGTLCPKGAATLSLLNSAEDVRRQRIEQAREELAALPAPV